MKRIDHLPPSEREHYEYCDCGEYFDCRNLDEVVRHFHLNQHVQVEWSHSLKVGSATAYTKEHKKLDLN